MYANAWFENDSRTLAGVVCAVMMMTLVWGSAARMCFNKLSPSMPGM
jgi:hypothetical protein